MGLGQAAGRGQDCYNALFVSGLSSSWGGPWQLPGPHSEKSGTTKALGQKGLWLEGLRASVQEYFSSERHG